MLPEPPPEYFEFLACYPEHVRETSLASRDFIVSLAPDASEFVVDATQAVSVGLSYTATWVKGFVFVATYPKHAILGFPYGSGLEDPEGRLRGEGKRVRHMRILKPDDLEDPYLAFLVNQSNKKGFRPEVSIPRKVEITRYKGPKRRPDPCSG
jgi:hypothetical protein